MPLLDLPPTALALDTSAYRSKYFLCRSSIDLDLDLFRLIVRDQIQRWVVVDYRWYQSRRNNSLPDELTNNETRYESWFCILAVNSAIFGQHSQTFQ